MSARTFRDGLLDGRMWERFGNPTHGRRMTYVLHDYVTRMTVRGTRNQAWRWPRTCARAVARSPPTTSGEAAST